MMIQTRKPNLFVTHFGCTFGTLRFDDKSFFHIILKFEPVWDYKPTIAFQAVSPGVYSNDKILKIGIVNKNQIKCYVIDGSVVNGVREPILFSFDLDKKPGYKVFCQPETILYIRINKSVLNTATSDLEDNDHKEVDFNGEILTFRLQMIEI